MMFNLLVEGIGKCSVLTQLKWGGPLQNYRKSCSVRVTNLSHSFQLGICLHSVTKMALLCHLSTLQCMNLLSWISMWSEFLLDTAPCTLLFQCCLELLVLFWSYILLLSHLFFQNFFWTAFWKEPCRCETCLIWLSNIDCLAPYFTSYWCFC